MGKYSIKELEKLSGTKAHTIRIWEKRYNIVQPERTAANIRLYSDDDLKKIINVSMLNSLGIKISVIAQMPKEEMNNKVAALSDTNSLASLHIDQLITSMIDLDEGKFEHELSVLEKKFGVEDTITEILYPFLQKIGILWQTENITPAHEHFISNLIRQKIIVAIAALPLPTRTTIRVVLFLPENELHEIGLLFFHYIVKKKGFKTFYLGQSVPHEDLIDIYNTHRPHLMITMFTSTPAPSNLNAYLKRLSSDFSASRILAAGSLLKRTSFNYPQNFSVFQTAADLRSILQILK